MESIYRPEVSRQARLLADIFRVLSWVVAVLGGIATVIGAASALDEPDIALLIGVAALAGTFVLWAQLALVYVIAGYVVVRLDETRPVEPSD